MSLVSFVIRARRVKGAGVSVQSPRSGRGASPADAGSSRRGGALSAALPPRAPLLEEGGRTRALRIRLEPFRLAGATTEPAAPEEPFRARFQLEERLDFYSEEELAEVVERAAPRLGVSVSPEGAAAIASRSRGTPREALRPIHEPFLVAQGFIIRTARGREATLKARLRRGGGRARAS